MSDDNYVPEHRAEEAEPIVGDPPPRRHVLFSNKVYDYLKFVAQVVLPALALFYLSVAPYWGFPNQEEVAGTVVAIDLLLGTILGISSSKYKSDSEGKLMGTINVIETEDKKLFDLNFPGDPEDIAKHDKVTFKVRVQ